MVGCSRELAVMRQRDTVNLPLSDDGDILDSHLHDWSIVTVRPPMPSTVAQNVVSKDN